MRRVPRADPGPARLLRPVLGRRLLQSPLFPIGQRSLPFFCAPSYGRRPLVQFDCIAVRIEQMRSEPAPVRAGSDFDRTRLELYALGFEVPVGRMDVVDDQAEMGVARAV